MKRKHEKLVNEHWKLVAPIARKLAKKFPKWVYLDDLISAGGEGLMQAAEKFDPKEGVLFKTFAAHRIRGAIWDWFRQEHGIRSKAFRRGISLLPWDQLEPGHDSPVVLKDNEWHKDPLYYKYDPDTLVSRADNWRFILGKAEGPHRYHGRKEKALIESYYGTNASMIEIAKDLNLSESRISQMHNYIIARYAVMISMGLLSEDVFCA